jgi:hypothetical protein
MRRSGQGDTGVAAMMGRICLFFAVFCTYGCAHVDEKPISVHIPIPVPCAVEVPKPELLTDEQFKALDDYRFVMELWLDRRLRQGYEGELEAALEGCR